MIGLSDLFHGSLFALILATTMQFENWNQYQTRGNWLKYCCRWRTRRALEWSRQASSCPPLPSNLRSLVLSTHILTQWLSSGNPTHAHMHTVIHPSSGLIRLKIFQLILTLSFMFLHVCLHLQTHRQTHATQHNTSVTAWPVFCRITGPPMPLFCLSPFSSLLYRRRPCKTFTAFSLCVLHTVDNQNELAHAGNKERVNPSDLHHPFILEFCQYLLTSCTVLYPKNEWQLGKFLGKCMHTSK